MEVSWKHIWDLNIEDHQKLLHNSKHDKSCKYYRIIFTVVYRTYHISQFLCCRSIDLEDARIRMKTFRICWKILQPIILNRRTVGNCSFYKSLISKRSISFSTIGPTSNTHYCLHLWYGGFKFAYKLKKNDDFNTNISYCVIIKSTLKKMLQVSKVETAGYVTVAPHCGLLAYHNVSICTICSSMCALFGRNEQSGRVDLSFNKVP